jgi:hypothetical protein
VGKSIFAMKRNSRKRDSNKKSYVVCRKAVLQ